ncbi:hypothetical protein PAXRUDRAFT_390187 [Paxillus rubicundulus Ve08.2h10]|uniref:Uncharacterized protein n=1 Tax=Paxillus rubicundulus Ve08.2h10 TaxID=930991 RepID=A0A0D0D108_9AGAM|nr:hypothetical protein PAXRUDRAFT_390187 [Paxillus rubicundulus Ve08.2h10]
MMYWAWLERAQVCSNLRPGLGSRKCSKSYISMIDNIGSSVCILSLYTQVM